MGGVGGEGEGRGVKEREEDNIVDPIKSLKVIHGCGYKERQGRNHFKMRKILAGG